MDPSNTNNLLQLARRLHEEHVREGAEKRDALIAEGQATAARTLEESQAAAARTVEESQAQAARILEEAQVAQRAQISSLDQERQSLEQRIDELRNFERDYRQKLKSYIEGQLSELDATGGPVLQPAGAPAAAVGTPSAPAPTSAAPAQNFGSPVAPPPANYPGFAGN
jgi:cell division septum initiation protein DivIVA